MNVTKFPTYDSKKIVNGVVWLASATPLTRVATTINVSDMLRYHAQDISLHFQNERNYYIVVDHQTIRLTRKQAACLTYLSVGKTIKQIASLLNCATSTVEDHIDRLKQKLGVYTTPALIDCFWDNPIKWF